MRAQMVSKFLHEIPQTPILVRVGTLCRWKNPRECESVPENESRNGTGRVRPIQLLIYPMSIVKLLQRQIDWPWSMIL